jgi:hypothetical protein
VTGGGSKSNQRGPARGGDGPGRRSACCSPVRPWELFHSAASTQYFKFIANQNAPWAGVCCSCGTLPCGLQHGGSHPLQRIRSHQPEQRTENAEPRPQPPSDASLVQPEPCFGEGNHLTVNATSGDVEIHNTQVKSGGSVISARGSVAGSRKGCRSQLQQRTVRWVICSRWFSGRARR